jgi:hypothetical protein
VSTRFYTYIFGPILRMKNRTIILDNEEPFILSPSGNAVISREGERVYATVFIKIPIYRSATEMSDEDKADFARLFSKIVTLSMTPFKISSQMYIINKDDYINSIRDKLNNAENLYQKFINDKNVAPNLLERVKGEVTMWHNLLESIGRTQSNALMNYVSVTASGGTEEEAVSLAIQQADELAAGIGATLGTQAYVLTGEEIFLVTQPEYMIPFSTVSEEMRQRSIEEGL